MQNNKKPNSLQKNRRSHFKEFIGEITNSVSSLFTDDATLPEFDQILELFSAEQFGLIHSFRTRNESIREFYEIFFDLFFETWMAENALNMRVGLFLVFFIIVDTIPKHLQVKVLVCQKKVTFLSLFLE